MAAFRYTDSPYAIPTAKRDAHRDAWARIAAPGSWWSGAERVAIVAAMRDAAGCELCSTRKKALSPFGIDGDHAGHSDLPSHVVDAIHRVTTDAARLTESFLEKTFNTSFTDAHYVEMLGVVVAAISIDTFHRALGLPLEALPTPTSGAPDEYRPPGAEVDVAWVPMLQPETLTDREADIFFGAPATANVIRALSLVPDAVRMLHQLAAVHYLPTPEVPNPQSRGGLELSRPQIELVAGRTSALNDCFY